MVGDLRKSFSMAQMTFSEGCLMSCSLMGKGVGVLVCLGKGIMG